jgi:hypothetical protein
MFNFDSIMVKHGAYAQAGFRESFSTLDHLQTIEQIIEKYKEFNRPLFLAFIDYSKAFDSISHDSLWDALHHCAVSVIYINVLKNIYENTTSRVRLETRGEEIPIERGVRQGDPLSPKLFIAVLNQVIRKTNWNNGGIRVAGRLLTHLMFADDIVVFAENSAALQEMVNSLCGESLKVGLSINESKTKIMTNEKQDPIVLNGKRLEYVKNYIYLGKQVSFNESSNEEEVDRRITKSWNSFWSQKEILKGTYPLPLKKIVLDTCILPTLTYASQTWVFTDKVKSKIVSCQRAMERSILKIRTIQKVRSEHIRSKTKITDALNFALRQKWNWAGHVARYTDKRWTIESTIWNGPLGKRRVGRPRKRWQDDIVSIAGKQWPSKSLNREEWAKLGEAFTQKGVSIQQ